MCRLAAYVGAPDRLSTMLFEAPHSLEVQAYRPREMVSGHVNVDGTGVAWWRPEESEPLLYVSEHPPWSDANLPTLARRLRGAPVLAVVRSQTPGIPAGAGAAHPFTVDGWAGAHNGYLEGFDRLAAALLGEVDDDLHGRVGVVSDSRLLFLVAAGALRRGASLADALRHAAERAVALCAEHDLAASLNLVLADRDQVVALRLARGVASNSLYTLEGGERWPAGAVVASEPLDADSGWRAVDDASLVTLDRDGVQAEPALL